MSPLEGGEEKKEEKIIKLLTRLPVLLAQIKARNYSYKIKKRNQKEIIFTLLA